MDFIISFIQKILCANETEKIGLSKFKTPQTVQVKSPSINSKDVKLSDLMRRAG